MTNFAMLGRVVDVAHKLPNDHLGELEKLGMLLNGQNGPAWKAYLARTRKGGLPERPVSLDEELGYVVVARTELDALPVIPTKDCFRSKTYGHRDPDLDTLLPAVQPDTEPCNIATVRFRKQFAFGDTARMVLGSDETNLKTLGEMLIARGLPMTLAQADVMAEKTKADEPTGMKTDGYANFFFVETGDPEMPVAVGHVDRRDGWLALVNRFGYGLVWYTDLRFLLRNMDT